MAVTMVTGIMLHLIVGAARKSRSPVNLFVMVGGKKNFLIMIKDDI